MKKPILSIEVTRREFLDGPCRLTVPTPVKIGDVVELTTSRRATVVSVYADDDSPCCRIETEPERLKPLDILRELVANGHPFPTHLAKHVREALKNG